jgi:hypothetical protein
MKRLPPLLIVTDRGRLLVYRTRPDDAAELHSTTTFREGNEKLSEMVTDQAGAFPNTGSAGTSTAERMPLVAELEVRCFRKIAAEIDEILAAEDGGTTWGLCAPPEIHGAIHDHLSGPARDRLRLQVRKDLVNSPPGDVAAAFRKASLPAGVE